tara:strand:+ start:1495 stop:2400 length:906 start_codon:yes stop_codon:yes gene_type:complete
VKSWLLLVILVPQLLFSQNYFEKHFGASIGLAVNVGSHQSSFGLTINAYWTDYFVQINANSTVSYQFYDLGERKRYWEMRNAAGLLLMGGKKEKRVDFQLDGLNHQTPYNYAVGFNYILYKDQAGTSQLSGGFAAHLKNLAIYHENDVFGGKSKDRFRTGQFHFSYRYEDYKFGIGLKMWTGETQYAPLVDTISDKMRGGYRILENLPYGKTSHGILYGSLVANLPYQQNAFIKLGVDSEQIRHVFQNRFIHDLLFLPKKVKHHSPHYPRLGEDGKAVFNKEDAKSNRYYFQFGMREGWYK